MSTAQLKRSCAKAPSGRSTRTCEQQQLGAVRIDSEHHCWRFLAGQAEISPFLFGPWFPSGPLAEAMPEEKWSFKPTQGAFTDVRTFAEQVKHVACANEAWAKKLRGETPPDHCDTGGPNPAKTKTEILAYLHESFGMMDGEIAKSKLDNLMAPIKGPYAGDNRLEVLNSALWHISDHYGQLVEYLRMNGIVPPASR